MPNNERGPGMRLSSGPEHLLLTNRPVIVTQSDPPSSSPLPLQLRGSPYSCANRRAARGVRLRRDASRASWLSSGLGNGLNECVFNTLRSDEVRYPNRSTD